MFRPATIITTVAAVGLLTPAAGAVAEATQSPRAKQSGSSSASPSPSPSESPSGSPSPSPTATVTPTPKPSKTPFPGPYGIPMNQPVREDSWCRVLIPNKKGDAARADSIMDDNIVDMGHYGKYRLSKNPDWKRQGGLDSSGNDHVNGLHWTIPLLYTGTKRGDTPMVERMYYLIDNWLRKHRKQKTRTWAVTQPIIAGERLWSLTCSSDMSNGARFVDATLKEAERQLKAFKLAGANNTMIHSQGSALAALCYLGDGRRDQAAANLSNLADYLVLKDGSDREGSPWYAYYTLQLMVRLEGVYDKCGMSYAPINAARKRLENFLAYAVDPDFHLVMNGDTQRAGMKASWFAPDSVTRWAATDGREGKPPDKLYTVFDGGYVFGRNSWYDVDGHHPTFYSVRTSRGPSPTAHTHNDRTSVTFNSFGAEWVGDPGPYRYDSSAIRSYMVSRSAHSVIRVTEKAPKHKSSALGLPLVSMPVLDPPGAPLTATEDPYNQTCVKDTTYAAARIQRCVYYDTGIDALVVVDSVKALKRIRADQRWQVPHGVTVSPQRWGSFLKTPNAAATVVFKGGGQVRKFRPSGKRQDGWFTNKYGELVKGTVLQRGQVLRKHQKRRWVTVIAAGKESPDVKISGRTVTVTRNKPLSFTLPK